MTTFVALTVLAAAPTLEERFVSRAYVSAGVRVPVSYSLDALAVEAPAATSPHAVALAVEAAALKLRGTKHEMDPVLVSSARVLRNHGLFGVELAAPVKRNTLVALAAALTLENAWRVHPVLTRMDGRAFSDGRLVVSAAPGQLEAVLAEVRKQVGGELVRVSLVPNTALWHVGAPVAFDAVEASARLSGIPGMVSAEPDLYREYAATATVSDPLHGNQWHLARPAANDPIPGVGQIFAHEAWDTTMGNTNVVVAVFDSGVDITHEDLVANIVGMFDPSANDDNASAECSASQDGRDVAASCPADQPYRESHGTAVSGVIAAVANNGVGLSGVCPGCKLLLVRLLGAQVGSGLSTAESFTRAVDQGAWVINNSWGPGRSRFFPMATAEKAAFDHARTAGRNGLGTVIVFAAGNDTSNVSADPYASHPFSIAVAASTNLDDWAAYSNYGRDVDIAAPSLGGVVAEDNHGLWTSDVTGADGYSADAYTGGFSGTSGASPVVAGVVGLMLSINPNLTAEQVRLVLAGSADKIVADKVDWMRVIGQDVKTIFAYDEAGHSIGFGYGRVNARAAVALAQNPPVAGGVCPSAACTTCTPDGRCLASCTVQGDCPQGTLCDAGACQFPHKAPGDVGQPCSAECPLCTSTTDTEGYVVSICTLDCMADADCPSGFDCRVMDPTTGGGLCAVGSRLTGNRDNQVNCLSDLGRLSVVVANEAGETFCTDSCYNNEAGACPLNFHCAEAHCACTVLNQNPCRRYLCTEARSRGWISQLCFPDLTFGELCASNLDCPPGDYCTVDGVCRVDDRAGCTVCNACNGDGDCGPGMTCLFTRTGAACVRGCVDDVDCPGDSSCRAYTRRTSTVHLCLSPSNDATVLCTSNYTCSVACRADVPCPANQMCDNGACIPAPPQPDAGGVPDAATGDAASGETPDAAVVQPPQGEDAGKAPQGPAVKCSHSTVLPAHFPTWGCAACLLALRLRQRRKH